MTPLDWLRLMQTCLLEDRESRKKSTSERARCPIHSQIDSGDLAYAAAVVRYAHIGRLDCDSTWAQLVEASRSSRATVARHEKRVEAQGWIKLDRQSGGASLRHLIVPPGIEVCAAKLLGTRLKSTPPPVSNRDGTRLKSTPTGIREGKPEGEEGVAEGFAPGGHLEGGRPPRPPGPMTCPKHGDEPKHGEKCVVCMGVDRYRKSEKYQKWLVDDARWVADQQRLAERERRTKARQDHEIDLREAAIAAKAQLVAAGFAEEDVEAMTPRQRVEHLNAIEEMAAW